jgi:hypothetical protein
LPESHSSISSYPLNDAAETVGEIGSSIRRVMGGTSGIMYLLALTQNLIKIHIRFF